MVAQAVIDPDEEVKGALDAAWKIHSAQVDWTGKVDSKASFAFGIQSAALGLVVALSADGRTFADRCHVAVNVLYWGGLTALLVGAAAGLLVVVPRLRSVEALADETATNFIYFGHLRHWRPEDLADRLKSDRVLDAVARQCVVMARIAWRKHRLVQLSMLSGAAGISALLVAALVLSTYR